MICRHAGVEETALSRDQFQALNLAAVTILGLISRQDPDLDQGPDSVAEDLQDLREHIQRIARRIAKLDPWVLSVAGQSELQGMVDAAGEDPQTVVAAVNAFGSMPRDKWLGWGLVDHLNRLDVALARPIEIMNQSAASLTPGPGAPPNLVARRVALSAATVLIKISGQPVSYWREATSFAKLTAELFRDLKGRPDTRRACEWALSELAKKP